MTTEVTCHSTECDHNKGLICQCRKIELVFPHMYVKLGKPCYKFKTLVKK